MLDLHSRANAKRLGIWLSCGLLLACTDPPGSPEEAVRAWVTEAVAAAENKDRRELLSLISPNYVDARGNERDDVGNLRKNAKRSAAGLFGSGGRRHVSGVIGDRSHQSASPLFQGTR